MEIRILVHKATTGAHRKVRREVTAAMVHKGDMVMVLRAAIMAARAAMVIRATTGHHRRVVA